jgi:hypothetical protein
MDRLNDPFVTLGTETIEADLCGQGEFAALSADRVVAPAVAQLHGFDVSGRPLLSMPAVLSGEIVAARTTVSLRRSMIGSDLLVLFEGNDSRLPVIVGVMQATAVAEDPMPHRPATRIQVDDEQQIIEAEREIVLRCGAASITLTRAGKVIIKGNYILSRSTGYNKIKGAAIDLN